MTSHPPPAAAAEDSASIPSPPLPTAGILPAGEANEAVLDKVTRRKLKKLRKKMRSGQLSLHDTEECKKLGMVVRAEVDWSEEIKDGRRPCLGPGDLRRAIVHILTAGVHAHCPSWLRLVNARLLTSVVVVSLAGVEPAYMQENLSQLPFLQACTRPIALRLYHGRHPRRCIYSLLFYPRPKQGGREGEEKGGGDVGEGTNGALESGESQKGRKRGRSNGNDYDDEEEEGEEEEGEEEEEEVEGLPEDDVTVSVDPAERYVLSLPQLKLAGFPLPPGGVIVREPPSRSPREKEGGHGHHDDDDDDEEEEEGGGGDDDDIGCPVSAGRGGTESVASVERKRRWLDCDEEGRWGGETGALLPSLEEARRILGGLNAVKVGGVTCCFYETLGEEGSEEEKEEGLGEEAEERRSRPYRMAALDCEMCQTTEGMEVTRLTLVDDQRQVLLDSFVKPHNDIIDYLTKYSGITPEMMAACTTTLEQVQVALLRLVRAETLLVGHSLEQDLMVVGIIHLRCVDTAILYPHPRGPQCRFALRVLVKKHLGRIIQDSVHGHCSREDAEAALDLVKLKMEHGPDFGVEREEGEGGGPGEDVLVKGKESFLEQLGSRFGKRCTLLDQRETLVRVIRGSSTSAVVCRSNEEVVSKAKAHGRQAVAPHFMWASLMAARPLTIESVEARRKRKMHQQQQQQQRMEAEATDAAAAAAAAAAAVLEEEAVTEREGGRRRQKRKGDVISLMSRNGSSSSLSSSSSSSSSISSGASWRSIATFTNSSSSSRMTTTTTRTSLREATTTTTLTLTSSAAAAAAAATTARQHKRFLYEESIMEMVEPDLLRVDQQLAELHESLPTNTLLLVLAQPDVALPTKLTHQRAVALNSRRTTLPWTEEHEATLEELAKAAQKGVVMMRVR